MWLVYLMLVTSLMAETEPEVRKSMRLGCEKQKLALGCYFYANYLSRSNDESADKYFKMGCDLGHQPACTKEIIELGAAKGVEPRPEPEPAPAQTPTPSEKAQPKDEDKYWTAEYQACSDKIDETLKEIASEGPGSETCKFDNSSLKAAWKAGSAWINCRPQEDFPCPTNANLKMVKCEREYQCVPKTGDEPKETPSEKITDESTIKDIEAISPLMNLSEEFLMCEKSKDECACEHRGTLESYYNKLVAFGKKYSDLKGKSIQYQSMGSTISTSIPSQQELDSQMGMIKNCK